MKDKKYSINWIHPFQTAKIGSVITGTVGLLFGVITYVTYALILYSSSLPESSGTDPNQELPPVQNVEPMGIVLVFFLYLFAGFFIGYVGALVYNILAKRIGGIEIGLKESSRL